MAVNTADDVLSALLPGWRSLLQDWSASGQLTAAAQESLQLTGTPEALQQLVGQWAAGDFGNLPPIVLLSAQDISGAMGAYAISTGTIYLNQDWLLGANQEQVQAVLTEELGHRLDGLLNAVDTPGDEGEYFSRLLNPLGPSQGEKGLPRTQTDASTISTEGNLITVEQAASSTPVTITFDDAAFVVANGYSGLNWGSYWNRTSMGGPINNYTGDKQAWTYNGLAVVTTAARDFDWKSAVFDNAYPYDTPLLISSYDDGEQVGALRFVIPGFNTPGLGACRA